MKNKLYFISKFFFVVITLFIGCHKIPDENALHGKYQILPNSDSTGDLRKVMVYVSDKSIVRKLNDYVFYRFEDKQKSINLTIDYFDCNEFPQDFFAIFNDEKINDAGKVYVKKHHVASFKYFPSQKLKKLMVIQ